MTDYCEYPQEERRPKKAWEFLKGHGWCQGWFARNAKGEQSDSSGQDAVQFCLLGALRRVYGDRTAFNRTLARVSGYLRKEPAQWNDAPERTQEDVVELLRALDL